jgi:hypothetical protein
MKRMLRLGAILIAVMSLAACAVIYPLAERTKAWDTLPLSV